MILDTEQRIKEYTIAKDGWKMGYWGEETINEIFERQAKVHSQEEALVDPLNKPKLINLPPKRYTWGEVDKIVNRLSLRFASLGIGPDDIVMIQLPNVTELILAFLALWRLGAITSPVIVQARTHELRYVLGHTEAKAFIVNANFGGFDHIKMIKEIAPEFPHLKHIIGLGKNLPTDVLSLEEMMETEVEGEYPQNYLDKFKLTANEIITICWTSGTEAEPKACPRSHNNWLCYGNLLVILMHLDSSSIIHTPFPLTNLAGFGTWLIPWIISGCKFVLHHPFDIMLYAKQIQDEKVTWTGAAPAIHTWLLKSADAAKLDFSSLKEMISGSAPLGAWAYEEWEKRGVRAVNGYSSNEGLTLLADEVFMPDVQKRATYFARWDGPRARAIFPELSKPIELKLVDPNSGEEVTEEGQLGELCGRAPQIISGYYKQPEFTQKAFDKDGFYHTGDGFIHRGEDYIEFSVRIKDLIIRGGMNISPEEIETVIVGYPKIKDAGVVGMPDPDLGERVCAYVVPEEGEQVTLEEICSYMREKGFAKYKLPERLEIINELPRNPVGKILKRKLREDFKKKLEALE